MESSEFEIKCKNAIKKILSEPPYEEDHPFSSIKLVWFSKALQNFKGVFVDSGKNSRYYECTYNGDRDELYVDVYHKGANRVMKGESLSGEAAQ